MTELTTYTYPYDLNSSSNSNKAVTFMAIKSLQAHKDGKDGFLNYEDMSEGEAESIIYLPTPTNLTDNQSHSWSQETTISAFEKISQGIGATANAAGSGFSLLGNTIGAKLSALFSAGSNLTIGTVSMASNIGKAPVIGLMSLMAGRRKALVNPGYFQNYASSSPRTFEFSYTFYSRNKDEALTALNIIRSFKMYSSPTGKVDVNKDLVVYGGANITHDPDGINVNANADSTTNSTSKPNSETDLVEAGSRLATTAIDKMAEMFGYMGQPNYWKISFSNSYIDRLLKLDYVVCTSVNVAYGNGSKLEMYSDGIPKVITLTLSFSEVKLKMREDFSAEFRSSDKNVTEKYNKNLVVNGNNKKPTDAKTIAAAKTYAYDYRTWQKGSTGQTV